MARVVIIIRGGDNERVITIETRRTADDIMRLINSVVNGASRAYCSEGNFSLISAAISRPKNYDFQLRFMRTSFYIEYSN